MQKQCPSIRFGMFLFFGIIFFCYSCNAESDNENSNKDQDKPDFSFNADRILLDTLFNDGSRFIWGVKNGDVKFRWTKGESYLERTINSKFDLSILKKEETNFIGGLWTNNGEYKSMKIYHSDSLIIFGFNYLPHGVTWYYVKWDNIVDFGTVSFDMKWYFPLIDEKRKMLFSIHEDFENDIDPADSIIHFYGKRCFLNDLPAKKTEDSICFRNYQIQYGCWKDNAHADSCSWTFLITNYNRYKDFFLSD